jgi:hypothetical protein
MNNATALCAVLLAATTVLAMASRAEDEPDRPATPAVQVSSGIVPAPTASMPAPGRPRGVPPAATGGVAPATLAAGRPAAAPAATPAVDAGAIAPASFASEEKWGMAGYNNNEPIYTILITSRDARIIRCTADLKGSYFENGEKLPITDRQTITVFPGTQVQVGNWSGMDQQSGAVYSVKCHPV